MKTILNWIKKNYQFLIIIIPAILFFGAALIVTCISSCKQIESSNTNVIKQHNDRFSVKYIQSFEDSTSYYGIRKIYIINDKITKKEYIGITGIGISEIIYESIQR